MLTTGAAPSVLRLTPCCLQAQQCSRWDPCRTAHRCRADHGRREHCGAGRIDDTDGGHKRRGIHHGRPRAGIGMLRASLPISAPHRCQGTQCTTAHLRLWTSCMCKCVLRGRFAPLHPISAQTRIGPAVHVGKKYCIKAKACAAVLDNFGLGTPYSCAGISALSIGTPPNTPRRHQGTDSGAS